MRISDWSSDVCSSDLAGTPWRWTAGRHADKRGRRKSPLPEAGKDQVKLLSEAEGLQALLASAGHFIVTGVTKSGTTWLQRMLDSHPEIACGGESKLNVLDRKSQRLNSHH